MHTIEEICLPSDFAVVEIGIPKLSDIHLEISEPTYCSQQHQMNAYSILVAIEPASIKASICSTNTHGERRANRSF